MRFLLLALLAPVWCHAGALPFASMTVAPSGVTVSSASLASITGTTLTLATAQNVVIAGAMSCWSAGGSGARVASWRVVVGATNGLTRTRNLSGTNDLGALSIGHVMLSLPAGTYAVSLEASTDNASNPIGFGGVTVAMWGASDGTATVPIVGVANAAGDSTTSASYAVINGVNLSLTLSRPGRIIAGSVFSTLLDSGTNATGMVALSISANVSTTAAQTARFVAAANDPGSAGLYMESEVLQPGTYTVSVYHKTDGGTWRTANISLWAMGTSADVSGYDLRQSGFSNTYAAVTTTTTGFDTITSGALYTEAATQAVGLFSGSINSAGGGAVPRTVRLRLFDGVSGVCEEVSRYLSGSNDTGAWTLVGTKAVSAGQCQVFMQAMVGSATTTVGVANRSAAFFIPELTYYPIEGLEAQWNLNNNGQDSGRYNRGLTTVGTVPYVAAPVKEGTYSAGLFSATKYFDPRVIPSSVFSSFSISFWAYSIGNAAADENFFEYSGTNQGIWIRKQNASATLRYRIGNGTDLNTGADFDISGNGWQLITFTYSGGTITAYKNATVADSRNVTAIFPASPSIYGIGGNNTVGRFLSSSYLDRFEVYSRALTASEVRTLYEAYAPPDPSLVAKWDFENNGLDSSGNGHTLTTNGTIPYQTSPVKSGTYSAGTFTAANYFTQTTSGLLATVQPQATFSVSWWAWVIGTTGGLQRIFEARLTAADRIFASLASDGTDVSFDSTVATANTAMASTGDKISFGKWQFHTIVLSPGNCSWYIDGTSVASANLTRTAAAMTLLYIGQISGQTLNGYLDDFRVYNRALSASEIRAMSGKRRDDEWRWWYRGGFQ